jgi:hypothetical protein
MSGTSPIAAGRTIGVTLATARVAPACEAVLLLLGCLTDIC